MIIGALNLLYPQEKLLAGSCYDVFLVTVLECIIEGLLKFGDGLNRTHRTNVLLLFLLDFTAGYKQVFLISSSIHIYQLLFYLFRLLLLNTL